ncbi:hypothetical protein HMPREF9123_2914 [Neisseria bacilliformis ATCC BAA-1200]|uniref:Uncharacterized protein n=1 Tax=Neisseria bacilliformis ATCC BAA-1200 TaxID=888742 RepID=F2BGQ7_9NEIS|nr:hypothetical protein HMPREF9123_2914 [Neisseria bacilliformis ATCC BAA-1200]
MFPANPKPRAWLRHTPYLGSRGRLKSVFRKRHPRTGGDGLNPLWLGAAWLRFAIRVMRPSAAGVSCFEAV